MKLMQMVLKLILKGMEKEMSMEKTKDEVIFDGDPNLKNCGHYKKDTPHKDIGLQKFRIPVRLIVDANFIVVSKNLPRAKELLQNVKKITDITFGDQYEVDIVHDALQMSWEVRNEEIDLDVRLIAQPQSRTQKDDPGKEISRQFFSPG